jgi:hypothetical protein
MRKRVMIVSCRSRLEMGPWGWELRNLVRKDAESRFEGRMAVIE